jgi:hypothetical protein
MGCDKNKPNQIKPNQAKRKQKKTNDLHLEDDLRTS